jgi:hypothetical protein
MDEKKDDVFIVSKEVYDLLESKSLSKRARREVLDLVCTRYGLRTAPIGVGLVSANQKVGSSPAGPKGPAQISRAPVNRDPEVVAAQESLDSCLAEIRALKAQNQEIPQGLIDEKNARLSVLRAAKQSFRDRSP